MKSTSMQVRMTSAVAAVAASALMVIGTGTLFSAPTPGTGLVQLDAVVVTPAAAATKVSAADL